MPHRSYNGCVLRLCSLCNCGVNLFILDGKVTNVEVKKVAESNGAFSTAVEVLVMRYSPAQSELF